MVSGYNLTTFPNAFIPQQSQLKKQPTKTPKHSLSPKEEE